MKRSEVQVGKIYTAKVSESLVPVRIQRDRGQRRSWLNTTRAERHDGWDAENLKTGRERHDGSVAVSVLFGRDRYPVHLLQLARKFIFVIA